MPLLFNRTLFSRGLFKNFNLIFFEKNYWFNNMNINHAQAILIKFSTQKQNVQ